MKKEKKSDIGKRTLAMFLSVSILIGCIGISSIVLAAANDWDMIQVLDKVVMSMSGKEVGDYIDSKKDITGGKLTLDDLELAEKSWYEYVEYDLTSPIKTETDKDGITYNIYAPIDYSVSSIMAIRDYNPSEINGEGTKVGVNWYDLIPVFESIAAGNVGVGLSGGVTVAIYGGLTQAAIAGTVWGVMEGNDDLLKNCKYYSTPTFMGIPGLNDWNGVSNEGFYNCSSLTLQMSKSQQLNVEKTNTVSSSYSVEGNMAVKASVKAFFVNATTDFTSKASSGLGYQLNFKQGQNVGNSESVSRTFSRRNDDEVKNVGWKLCEYVVQVPYYVVATQEIDGETVTVLEQYVTYNLLSGVCSVYANGYIEHWGTGELVSYADFFEGFVTATDLIDTAKKQQNEQGGK